MISNQSIKSEQDYERALAEVERLWGITQGTPNGDKLDSLIDLVETKHYPVASPADFSQLQAMPSNFIMPAHS